jgi:hypothetical protein
VSAEALLRAKAEISRRVSDRRHPPEYVYLTREESDEDLTQIKLPFKSATLLPKWSTVIVRVKYAEIIGTPPTQGDLF